MGQRIVTTGVVAGWCFVLSIGLVAGGLQATPRAVAAKMKNPVATSATSVTAGQQIYQKQCRMCHGAAGAAETPIAKKMMASDLTDATWTYGSTDGEIFAVIQDGVGPDFKMKAFKGKVSDQDTWHLVNYVRSLAAARK
jgi:mono/diheme cytochrome c family protein